MDLCMVEHKTPNNADFSPHITEDNRHVETFQEKFLLEKLKLEKPLIEELMKKKSLGNQNEDCEDCDGNYEKDGFVPMFNFNSNKSKTGKEPLNSSQSRGNYRQSQSLDNDCVELGTFNTNDGQSPIMEAEESKEDMRFQGYEEREGLFRRDRYIEGNGNLEGAESEENDEIIYHLDENNCLLDETGHGLFWTRR